MGAYKQLLTSDIIVTPFEVHKGFTFVGGAALTPPNVGIDRFIGTNITGSLFNPLSDPTTGNIGTQYQRLVYSSIKELYYSNYLSSSYGDQVNRQILVPGRDEAGNRYVGAVNSPLYDNYLQTTLTYSKFFPTGSGAQIGVISIPAYIFGDYVEPYSFKLSFTSQSFYVELTDDGEGNIIYNQDNSIVGNIFYPHGIIVLTGTTGSVLQNYTSSYGTSGYGGNNLYGQFTDFASNLLEFITSSYVTCSFSSSYKIYETQYKCTIRSDEFTYTLNPSTISGSGFISGSLDKNGIPYSYVNEDYFNPYITTVGLYDEQQNLLAVGKLAQPLPSSPTTDTTILINIDR